MSRLGFVRLSIVLGLCAWALAPARAAEPVRVVVTIKPLHALVAGVMEGVGEPALLISGGGSPHSYALKPSEATALRKAQVVVRVSEHLESFLDRPIKSLAKDAKVVTMDDLDGVTLLEPREGGVWDEHDHDHEEQEHEAHGQAAEAEGGHDHDQEHAGEHGREHEEHNPHLWLTPANARVLVDAMAKTLAEADPGNATRYQANAKAMHAKLAALDAELRAATKPLAGKPYVVFHDAYHYFEDRYGLSAAGSITVSPERQPGAKRLTEIRDKIKSLDAVCVFAEPQFEPKLINTLIEGTSAKRGVLDPLGAALPAGPALYFELMRGLATSLSACLLQ
jgi:zinc transport system substrate-binding protein